MSAIFVHHRRAGVFRGARCALAPRALELLTACAALLPVAAGCTSLVTHAETERLPFDKVAAGPANATAAAAPMNTPAVPTAPQPIASGGLAGVLGLPAPPPDSSVQPELAPTRLSLEQALRFTLDNHPRLRARRQEMEIARSKLMTASLLPNPQFVLDADQPVSKNNPTELSGRVMFTVPTAGKRCRAEEAADAGIIEARIAIDSEADLLLAATADAALEVLYQQELAELERQLAKQAGEAAEIQRNRAELRGVPATQQIATDIAATEVELDLLSTEQRLDEARIALSRALGFVRPEYVSVEGILDTPPVPEIPIGTLLAVATTVRPELAQAQAAIAKSQRDVAAAQAKAVPDFQIGPRWRVDLGNNPDDKVGMRFNSDLPWFDRKQGDIYGAESRARVDEARRDEVQLNTQHDVADAYLQLRRIEAALAQYERRAAPLAQRTEKLLEDAKAVQGLDLVAIYDDLRRLGGIRRKNLRLRYQHNLLRVHLELLLKRRLNDVVPPPARAPEAI